MKKDISKGLLRVDSLKDVADQIETQGGTRVRMQDHLGSRAGTLSDVINKIKSKGGSVSKLVNNPMAKKAALGVMGPVGLALGTAQDVMASDDANVGADEPYLQEEALLESPYENFADPEISEQARRYQKIRAMLGRE
jgi:hypothetical protein